MRRSLQQAQVWGGALTVLMAITARYLGGASRPSSAACRLETLPPLTALRHGCRMWSSSHSCDTCAGGGPPASVLRTPAPCWRLPLRFHLRHGGAARATFLHTSACRHQEKHEKSLHPLVVRSHLSTPAEAILAP